MQRLGAVVALVTIGDAVSSLQVPPPGVNEPRCATACGPAVREVSMLKMKIVIGSTRPGRAADRVFPWITGRARLQRARSGGTLPPAAVRLMAGRPGAAR